MEDRQRSEIDWGSYFASIKHECPWSYTAWKKGQIDIVRWDGSAIPLGNMQARVYLVENENVENLAKELDVGECEWLFSYPGYGDYATPVPVLIQQSRLTLKKLRESL